MGPVINLAAGSAAGSIVNPTVFLVEENIPAAILLVKIGSAVSSVVNPAVFLVGGNGLSSGFSRENYFSSELSY